GAPGSRLHGLPEIRQVHRYPSSEDQSEEIHPEEERQVKSMLVRGSAVVFWILALAGCEKAAAPAFQRPPAAVAVAAAVTEDVPVYLDAIGKIVAREMVSIQPQVSGRIMEIHFTDGAEAQVQQGRAAVENAQLNLQYCSIRSPIDGRAGRRLVDIGNVVTGNSGSLLTIQRLDPIYADFTVTENDLSAVQRNMRRGT